MRKLTINSDKMTLFAHYIQNNNAIRFKVIAADHLAIYIDGVDVVNIKDEVTFKLEEVESA